MNRPLHILLLLLLPLFCLGQETESRAQSSAKGNNGQMRISYHYYLKDHQGNNRVVVNAESGAIEQVNHYYPYGGLMAESTGGDRNAYKYNGKELDRMHGLDWMDYGARWMDGMRFTATDPLAGSYPGLSPYVYCADNPVKYVDPDGRSIWTKILKLGVKAGKAVSKNGFKALSESSTYTYAFSDIANDIGIITGANVSASERFVAGISLISEAVSPVSINDLKAGAKVLNLSSKSINNARRSAVRKAWRMEKKNVEKSHMGSRKWTKSEIQELKEKGKVSGYEGHHINNVRDHPGMAGNPDNVEFLTREEHLKRHNGNFRNKTEGNLIKRE